MTNETKLIRVLDRKTIPTSRGTCRGPIGPYRENLNRILVLISRGYNVVEVLPDNSEVKLNEINFDKDNTIIDADDEGVTITRKGLRNLANRGQLGSTKIPYWAIASINYRKSTIFGGKFRSEYEKSKINKAVDNDELDSEELDELDYILEKLQERNYYQNTNK